MGAKRRQRVTNKARLPREPLPGDPVLPPRKRGREARGPVKRRQLGEDPFMLRFRKAAEEQRVCQHPACTTPTARWSAHHVVYRQELARRRLPEWDPRDALRLCENCHVPKQHQRTAPVPTTALLDNNIAFAFEVLGLFAADYLRRFYDDSTPDPRIAEHEHRLVAA